VQHKSEYLMNKHSNVTHAFWSWLGFVFVIAYLLWVTYVLVSTANCTAMILDLCDLGKIVVSFPWIIAFAPKGALEPGTLFNLVVAVSIVFNTVTVYLVGMGLQKLFNVLGPALQRK
jgi:hypothetical protein